MLRMSGRIQGTRSRGERDGATVVLIAVLLVVLFSFTAFAIDFGRAYLVNAQLQTSADAAALAGAFELRSGSHQTGYDSAAAMAVRNKVQKVDPNVISIEPGFWDDGARTFTPAGAWDVSGVNAVRARTGHQMGYTFARVMGFTNIDLAKPAVAAVGYSSITTCVKPWAVSYEALLNSVFGPGVKDIGYNLTAEDIELLAQNQNVISLLEGNQNQITPGNVGQVDTWEGNANRYKDAVRSDCYDDQEIGAGDQLPPAGGAGPGQTADPLADFCGVSGNSHLFTCNRAVKVAVYDSHNGASGANIRYNVKFIGAFVVVCYNKGTGNVSREQIRTTCNMPDYDGDPKLSQIFGYFTSMPDEGGGNWTTTPSPLIAPVALVQ
jgi:Flp pilus assembly protein TadG